MKHNGNHNGNHNRPSLRVAADPKAASEFVHGESKERALPPKEAPKQLAEPPKKRGRGRSRKGEKGLTYTTSEERDTFTVYLPRSIGDQVRLYAAVNRMDMIDVFRDAIELYFTSRHRRYVPDSERRARVVDEAERAL